MCKQLFILIICLSAIQFGQLHGQEAIINNSNLNSAYYDETVYFSVTDTGVYKPITWGLDLAWLDEINIRRGIAFMGGKENVDVVRSSFIPTEALLNGKLQGDALANTNLRIEIINRQFGSNMNVVLNCDHPSVHSYFYGNAVNWAALIDETTRMHQEAGFNVITVSPFNEPDYTETGQGTINDFYNIILELKKNSRFNNIRISGGNTLSTDAALGWYNQLNPAGLDEGNTHQLAGGFDSYANFYNKVRTNGDHATNDELHNVMDAMVGAEYGMQTGIWWGTAEYTRGEFVKASNGRRLGYAENRPKWTAASVYRAPDGKVQAFIGGSERQAATTTFRFVSTDKDVFFDGHGPQREYLITLPGGAIGSYQNGQTNAEKVINITWGEDIQPVINGRYVLVNRNSGKVVEAAGGSSLNGTNIQQNTYSGKAYQQWNVNPIDPRAGGDFSYFTIQGVASGKHLDVNDFSLDNAANILLWEEGSFWDGRQSINQLWYLEYAEDGWFYIRNLNSAKCLEVANGDATSGANIQQYDKDEGYNQQWRFLPIDAAVEFAPPAKPTGLKATSATASIFLEWNANTDTDFDSYIIFRSDRPEGPYNTIARGVTMNNFKDESIFSDDTLFYAIKAMDHSLNKSAFSSEIAVQLSKGIVVDYKFEHNVLDSSVNQFHSTVFGDTLFVNNQDTTSNALQYNGFTTYTQLPESAVNHKELSVAMWINWQGGAYWQRVFDFGKDENESLSLATLSDTIALSYIIKKGDIEEHLYAPILTYTKWMHVTLTIGESKVSIYQNGELVSESDEMTLSPQDINFLNNYIGRGQGDEPLLAAYLDDFRVYNYALSADEVRNLYAAYGPDYDDCTLSDISASEGTLNPEFNPEITYYTLEVASDISSLTLTATPNNVNATVVGDGTFDNLSNTPVDVNIEVMAEDGTSSCNYTISISKTVGVNTNELSNINIYPIPAEDILHIMLPVNEAEIVLYDASGKVVIHEQTLDAQVELSVVDIETGLYLLMINTELSTYNQVVTIN